MSNLFEIPHLHNVIETMKGYYNKVCNYTITFVMYLNYYIQHSYSYMYEALTEVYYTHIDTDYEVFKVHNTTQNSTDINILSYTNFKTSSHVTIKSNTITFEEHELSLQNTKDLLHKVINRANPLLSAIITISNKEDGY